MMFLCPMSGFNQRLSEDRSVNRLVRPSLSASCARICTDSVGTQYDSMELWETVCRSKLLSKATFILLLNKADLLHAKLKAGEAVGFRTSVPHVNLILSRRPI